MPHYTSSVDSASNPILSYTSSGQFVLVDAGVTLIAEDNSAFIGPFGGQTIYNYGSIFAQNSGIYLYGGGNNGDQIVNYGTISAGADGSAGVGDENGHTQISNRGTINGHDVGAELKGAGSILTNTGSIFANTAVHLAGDSQSVVNRGDLEGDVESDGTNTKVRNSGTIQGGVTFSSGANLYDGRGGSVDGVITGGSGTDRIIAGSDGETMGGGAGQDRLYGGAGSDTFAFASFAPADIDHIMKFDVAKDTIQLDSSIFKKLAADTTPTFAVATAATSATDYLFYNSSTGVLSYDPDGNGTHYKGYAVAVLDTGLALKAGNFTVS